MKTRVYLMSVALIAVVLAGCPSPVAPDDAADSARSANATLASLSLADVAISPAFDPDTTSYSAVVANDKDMVTVSATVSHPLATVTSGAGSHSLSVGSNAIDVVVTAEDGTSTKTYTIMVERETPGPSSNADLASLSVSAGTLSPSFDSDTTDYSVNVGFSVSDVTVGATAAHTKASVTSGAGSHSLSFGSNLIDVVVEAEDGTEKTYSISITRAAPSANANLASLSLSVGTLSPSFNAGTTTYSATVEYLTTDVTVSASTADSTATIVSGTGSYALSLGDNVIEVEVEAQDASTKTYTVTVTRDIAATFRARTATDDTWYDVSAQLLGSGDHVEVFVEDGHGITASTAAAIADEFDDNIYDMIHENFATEVDVDGNGKVILLLLDIVDGFTGSGGYVAGYFDPTHMFSTSTEVNSNEADMLFMDVDPAVPGSDEFYSTIAHEMQHLVNFSVTYLDDQTIQDTWINEGLSSGAEYLYAGGHITSRIDYYNNDPVGTIVFGNNFYIWYGFWELGAPTPDPLANYATVYLFFQWLRIHASNDTEIYSDILTSDYRDYRAVVDAAEARIDLSLDTWEEVLGTWMQANLLTAYEGAGLQGYGGEIALTSWVFENTGGGSGDLSSGEGVAVATASDAFSYPGGSGENIRYQGIDIANKTVDSTGPNYDGDVVIAFNSSTLIAPSDPYEVAVLPSVSSSGRSLLLSVNESDPSAMPETYPVGVRFTPGDGFTRDSEDGQSASRDYDRGGKRR